MIKRSLSSLLALVCMTTLLFVTSATASAQAGPARAATLPPVGTAASATVQTTGNQVAGYTADFKTLSPSAVAFSHLLVSTTLIKQFTVQNRQLGLAEPIATLTAQYHLQNSDVQQIEHMLAFSQQAHSQAAAGTVPNPAAPGAAGQNVIHQNVIQPYLSVHNWIIYFTNWDVTAFLFAAAQAGPWALDAAFSWIGSVFGGPIGLVLGVVLGIVGYPVWKQLCYLVLQAGWMGRGIYLGIQWNWAWPNVVSGIW